MPSPRANKNGFFWVWPIPAVVAVCCVGIGGCSSLWPGTADDGDEKSRIRELLAAPDPPELIRDAAVPYGLSPIRVSGVAAINGLPGTGGPADPSPDRDRLIEEMKRENIQDPNLFLESADTALVRVRAVIPPGARRGDPLDLQIVTPPRSQVDDLHGGWLMNTRLHQEQRIRNSVRRSDVKAIGIGPVLTRADYRPSEDAALKVEGKVLAGGRAQVDRKLGLLLRPEYQHVKMSAHVASAVNQRFFFFDGTTRRGIAEAVEDDFVEIEVHPRYRGNEYRMMEVLRSIQGQPSPSGVQSRLAELGRRLKVPDQASDAALQLEAMGETAIPTLLDGLKSDNPELRFYAAESLAYLDRRESIEPLERAAVSEPAFRQPAMAALEGLQEPQAADALRRLMNEPSLETRYGAFRALRRRSDGRLKLRGETVGESLRLYTVDSTASPAVVVSLRETPEIVLFGEVGAIEIPDFLFGPAGVMLRTDDAKPGHLRISRFQPGEEDRRAVVASSVDGVAKGIVGVGGGYGAVVAVLRKAKSAGFLRDQLAFDPLPESMRTYYRDDDEGDPRSDGSDDRSEDGSAADAEDTYPDDGPAGESDRKR